MIGPPIRLLLGLLGLPIGWPPDWRNAKRTVNR